MIFTAFFHFQSELNEFISARRRNISFPYRFEGPDSIKDLIEALGVPHTEIEAMLVNSQAVDFNYVVGEGDKIEVYGLESAAQLTGSLPALRPPFPANPGFVLDTHLGQLATFLRMFGFNTLYRNDYPDEELAQISSSENRILLTRDRGLLKRNLVVHGYYVRQINPRQQLIEIIRRFQLMPKIAPLRRCIRCNGELQAVSKTSIADRLEPKTSELYDEFSLCPNCNQIYWKGSHYEQMKEFINEVLGKS